MFCAKPGGERFDGAVLLKRERRGFGSRHVVFRGLGTLFSRQWRHVFYVEKFETKKQLLRWRFRVLIADERTPDARIWLTRIDGLQPSAPSAPSASQQHRNLCETYFCICGVIFHGYGVICRGGGFNYWQWL